ncbi:MAG: DsbA family protein [Gemmatimonadaceae bacterium]|nr:DsbA family protein [Gemmatimonadaceae bacterium]
MSQLRPEVSADDHSVGPVDAPITLVEFGDYECPHCGRAYPVVKQLQATLGDSLRFVFRNFPLSEIHPHASAAAQAAEAAGESGSDPFWAMHDLLYEHQRHLDTHSLLRYAETAGADPVAVQHALDAGSYVERVNTDFMSGVRSGVNGTPTFFINGVRYNGDWSDVETFLADLTAARTSP